MTWQDPQSLPGFFMAAGVPQRVAAEREGQKPHYLPTMPSFCHSLLVTRASPDARWPGTTQW